MAKRWKEEAGASAFSGLNRMGLADANAKEEELGLRKRAA